MLKSLVYKLYTFYKYFPDVFQYRFEGFKNTSKPDNKIKNKNILFCPLAPHKLNVYREAVFAFRCKLEGAEVSFLSCDLDLKYIDYLNPQIKKNLPVSYWIVRKMFQRIGAKVHYLSDYKIENTIDVENISIEEIECYEYKNIPVGDLAISSTVRYFFSNGTEYDNPVFVKALRGFLKTAINFIDIYEKLLEDVNPDKIVMSHGIYTLWGSLFRLARSKNIGVDVYGGGYRKNTIRFYHNIPNAPFPEGDWAKYKHIPLSEREEKIVDEYFMTRSTQKEDSISIFNENDILPEYVKDFINKAKAENKKLFCLFTNISWDAFMFKKGNKNSFNLMSEWLTETIEYFQKQENFALIIKAHPVEAIRNVPDKYRVKHFIPNNLNENFLFINENAKVKPFDLYDYIDYGLIFISTVAIEMAMLNIPVITAGVGGHYSNKGFTIDPENKKEYFEMINKAIKGELKYNCDIEQTKRYLYFRFFREAILFDEVLPLTKEKKTIKPNMLYSNGMNIIAEGILNDGSYYN